MPIGTVKQLCTASALVKSDSLTEQVAQIEDFAAGRIDGREFFERNHFTDGLNRLVERGFERLAGRTDDGAFYLTPAMGGGKTHSLIALGLLAGDPALREEVVPRCAAGREFGSAKVVIFNGHQNPENLLWGFIAAQLGKADVMVPFWKNGARTPGVDEWVAVLGEDPVLILLDELPSYLQMAQGEPVGNTTLGELTIGALERLFNALPRCPRACVVVTNLKDDVYLDGSAQLRTLIENLTKHYDRNAQAITPVQQNTGEVFAIVRKRLFDSLPPADRIDEIAQAYVDALQKAKRVDTIATTPETFIERIRETYPFHPWIRDIVARFAENRGYQKTRALIRILRLATRGALASNDNAFLIGLQHLDFNDQGTIEEIRKINPSYGNAIAHDVQDRGNALAERIDAKDGNSTGTAVAKELLMSSLSTAETPLRGLTDGELIETLVDPLLEVSELKAALGQLQGQAWYLFKGIDQRVFFGPTANVTAEIAEIAAGIAEEHVDQTLREKLREVFRPRTGALYSDHMSILPGLDEIKPDEDRPTLVILERPADKLPQDFVDWWGRQDMQNRVLVLTADANAVATLRVVCLVLRKRLGEANARRMEIESEIEVAVQAQLDHLTAIDEAWTAEALYTDGDLTLAAYAAALQVVTAYSTIDRQPLDRDLYRKLGKNEKTALRELLDYAGQVANGLLVPNGFPHEWWGDLKPAERFYVRMLDMESKGAAKVADFQNFAKSFALADYTDLMASTAANAASLAGAGDLKGRMLDGEGFAKTPLRQVLFAICKTLEKDDPKLGVTTLRSEYAADYWQRRQKLIGLADYIAAKTERTRPKESAAAHELAEALRLDKV